MIPKWALVGHSRTQDDEVRSYPICAATFTVGRKPQASLTLSDPTISGLHAEFTTTSDGRLLIRDLNSTNGTFISGRRITEQTELTDGVLVHFAKMPFRITRTTTTDASRTEASIGESLDTGDQVRTAIQLQRLIENEAISSRYQPIVSLESERPVGFEVFSRGKIAGLQDPNNLFYAATVLNREVQLSNMLRRVGVERWNSKGSNLFLGTHPEELLDEEFHESVKHLRSVAPNQDLTFQIPDCPYLEDGTVNSIVRLFRRHEFNLAIVGFGIGEMRLANIDELSPDFVKFDMKLTGNIDQIPPKQQDVVASFVNTLNSIGIQTVATGIETMEAHTVAKQMGFCLGQGFHYGFPSSLSEIELSTPIPELAFSDQFIDTVRRAEQSLTDPIL